MDNFYILYYIFIMNQLKIETFIKYIFPLLIFFIFCVNLFNYEIKFQHDATMHHNYIYNILTLNFSKIDVSYGIFYYILVSFIGFLISPLYFFDVIDPRIIFYLAIRITNIILFISFFLLIKNLSAKIFGKKNLYYYYLPYIIFSFGFINKTFFMARPENIMLPLSVVLITILWKSYKKSSIDNKSTIFFIFSGIILGSQKISGYLFLIICFLFLIFFLKNTKKVLQLILITFFSIFFYYWIHFLITDIPFYERPYGIDDSLLVGFENLKDNFKDLNLNPYSIFFNLSVTDAWESPLRDNHWTSMINILLLDIYGDYWNYGTFNYIREPNLSNLCLISINRFSLILGSIYFIVVLFSIIYLFVQIFKYLELYKKNIFFNIFICSVFLGSFLIFFFGALNELEFQKSGIFKFEYISFFFIYSAILVLTFIKDNIKINKIILNLFLMFAYFQILPIRC